MPALTEIQAILRSNADQKNKTFFEKIVPGQQKIYGVKTPVLNTIVKQFSSGSFQLAEQLWDAGSMEEKIIAIKIIEKKGKSDPHRLLKLFKRFAPQIDNWAVCDGLGMQFLRGIVGTHSTEIFAIATKYSFSKNPWQRRLALVMVERYTRWKEFHPAIRQLLETLKDDKEYYVKKAVTWINKNLKKGK